MVLEKLTVMLEGNSWFWSGCIHGDSSGRPKCLHGLKLESRQISTGSREVRAFKLLPQPNYVSWPDPKGFIVFKVMPRLVTEHSKQGLWGVGWGCFRLKHYSSFCAGYTQLQDINLHEINFKLKSE